MAVTKEQMAKWSKNFEARYPNEKKNTGTGTQTRTQTTAVRQVTAAQMNQWEQGYQTMQANREREERNRTSPMTNKVTLAQQAAAKSPVQAGTTAQTRLPTRVTTTKQPEWTQSTRKVLGTVTADELARNVLGYMSEPEKSNTGSPVKTDRQEDYEPDWNYAGNDNTPKQRAIAQGTYGSYAKAAQAAGKALSQDRQTDRFDELNQWMDADPKNRELVNLLRQKKTNYTSYAQEGTSAPGSTAPGGGTTGKTYAERGTTQTDGDRWNTEAKYTDAQLRAKGYTQQQINEARQYLKEYSAFNPAETLTRRTADTAKGILATVASAVPMAGEDAVQAVKNETATTQNWKELQESVQGNARQKELLRLMTSGKVQYAETSHAMQPSGVAEEPKSTAYTDRELIKKGYSQDEIDAMRQRIAGVKVKFTELEGAPETRYQLDVDSEDVEAARRQSVGDGGAETETLAKVMAQADGAQVSDESLERIARKMVKTSDSRADAKTLTSRLQALRNYLGGGDVDWAQAHGFVLDMAQQIMEGSAKKNDELWKAYPDLHKMGMSLWHE